VVLEQEIARLGMLVVTSMMLSARCDSALSSPSLAIFKDLAELGAYLIGLHHAEGNEATYMHVYILNR
jgi:hypothetical protein